MPKFKVIKLTTNVKLEEFEVDCETEKDAEKFAIEYDGRFETTNKATVLFEKTYWEVSDPEKIH